MRWRDIRFEKPTEHDQEGYSGEVLVAYKDNTKQAVHWMDIGKTDATHWAPLSELPDPPDRTPDPPALPEPQYRPYNAAELKQTIGMLVDGVAGYTAEITGAWGDFVYCQGQKVSAEALLKDHAWAGGGKCGVRIDQ
jgi:hypothetical protein